MRHSDARQRMEGKTPDQGEFGHLDYVTSNYLIVSFDFFGHWQYLEIRDSARNDRKDCSGGWLLTLSPLWF
jgi:hypothetical protein